jgi:hypothetical protein
MKPARNEPYISYTTPDTRHPTTNNQHAVGLNPYPLHSPAARRDAAALPRAKRLFIN